MSSTDFTAQQHINRAKALADLKRVRQAAVELEKALLLEPTHYYGLALICWCYLDMRDRDQAQVYTDKFLAAYPFDDEPYYYKARYFYRLLNNYEQSLVFINQAIAIDPERVSYYGFKAANNIVLERWHDALECTTIGLTLEPTDWLCLNHRVNCLVHLGDKKQTEAAVETLLGCHPNDSYAHQVAGQALLSFGAYETAYVHLVASLRLEPHNEEVQQKLKEAIRWRSPLFRTVQQIEYWSKRESSAPMRQKLAIIVIIVSIGGGVLTSATNSGIFMIPALIFGVGLLAYQLLKPTLDDIPLLSDPYGQTFVPPNKAQNIRMVLVGVIISAVMLLGGLLIRPLYFYLSLCTFLLTLCTQHYLNTPTADRSKSIPILYGTLVVLHILGTVCWFVPQGKVYGVLLGMGFLPLCFVYWLLARTSTN